MSIGVMDMLKLTFRAIEFKYEAYKLNTGHHAVLDLPLGPVRGVKRKTIWGDEYYSFERIPYAKPPLGELRFRAPQPIDPWDKVLDCTSTAEKPMQAHILFRKYQGSEDCLYLNVFTNNIAPDKLRPVMVWIYGGGFQLGEASRDMYSPDHFMASDVVLVTIAYRLGPFGFLSLDDPSVDVPGNAGIKDQIMSLQWVRDNISAFGGDPENVTLFGESAGGASTHLCMLSERSKGLIHKGILMSGSALCPWSRPPSSQWAFRLAQKLGYHGDNVDADVFRFLQNVAGSEIVKSSSTLLTKDEKHRRVLFAFGPTIEPYATDQAIITEDPYELLKTTWSNSLPMMIGGTSFEGLLFFGEVTRRPATLTEVGICKNLLPMDISYDGPDSKEAEEHGRLLKKAYFGDEECSSENRPMFLELESHREFWHPMYRTALARIRHGSAPTYVYRFDFDSAEGNAIRNLLCGRGVRGVCHGDDLCYLFYSMLTQRSAKDSPEHRVTCTMVDIWTSFAARGDPNCARLEGVRFEPLGSEEDTMKCLNIAAKAEFMALPEVDSLKVWNSFYPQGKL